MPNAHTNGEADGDDEDIIVGKEDLVIRVVSINVFMQILV